MNRMKELRENLGITMREAANRLGMPYTTYVNYEKGVREPSSETLIQIANFFDVSIDYLLFRTDVRNYKHDTADPSDSPIQDEDIMFALFGGDGEITDAMYNEVRSFAEYVRQREAKKAKASAYPQYPASDRNLRVASPVILPSSKNKSEK